MSFVPPPVAPISWQGFLDFLQNQVRVPAAALPPSGDSFVIDSSGGQVLDSSGTAVTSNPTTYPPQVWSLVMALDFVNCAIALASQAAYNRAVYCFATDRMIQFAQDQPNQTWFTVQRETYGIAKNGIYAALAPGVVSSSSDQSTSTSIMNPEQMERLTIMDLQQLRTPWGREYLSIAQSYGQTLFGVT